MMATVQDRVRPTSPARFEGFVEQQLARARWRIRLLDLAAAGLGLVGLTLVYALGMVLLDRWLELPSLFRQAALGLFGVIVVGFLGYGLLRPWLWRVNPYYAARQVEQILPGAKNSVVNWLDLRDQKLPPAIRQAVGTRAARDLAQADLERAFSGRHIAWLGGLTAALLVGAIVAIAILRPTPFFSLLARAFAPFVEGTIATRTRIALLEPVGGDATVAVKYPVSFAVHIDGRVPDRDQPDAVRLLFRYNQADPGYQERPFRAEDHDRHWVLRLPEGEVHNGFWYKVAAGDAETSEYRVQVRSTPLFTGFDVTYHFRDYLRWSDTRDTNPNLKQIRGTEVRLIARTNRNVKEGRLLIKGQDKPLQGKVLADDPTALQFDLVLDRDGQYTIEFTSLEGEVNRDPPVFSMQVTQDQAPRVELFKPGANIQLHANGLLSLEGVAADDIGLTAMALQMRVKDGPALDAKPFREGKSFQFKTGEYPQRLDYRDFVELDRVTQNKAAFPLKPGMVLEYWVEATDNCDFPEANVGKSPVYEVEILAPEQDQAKQDQEKNNAGQQQKEFEKKQDENLKQEDDAAAGQKPMDDPAREAEQKKIEEQRRQLEEAIKNEQQKNDEKAEAKPETPQEEKGEPKNAGDPPMNGQPQNQAEDKPQPNPDPQAGQDKKDQGGQDKKDQGDKKPDGQPQGDDQKADSKPQQGDGQPQAAQDKNAGQQDPNQARGEQKQEPQPGHNQAGEGKNEGKPDQAKGGPPNAGENKPENQPGQGDAGADGKPQPGANQQAGGDKGQPPDQKQADGQGKPQGGGDQQAAKDKGQGQPQAGEGMQNKGQGKGPDQNPVKDNSQVADGKAPAAANQQPAADKTAGQAGQEQASSKGQPQDGNAAQAGGDKGDGQPPAQKPPDGQGIAKGDGQREQPMNDPAAAGTGKSDPQQQARADAKNKPGNGGQAQPSQGEPKDQGASAPGDGQAQEKGKPSDGSEGGGVAKNDPKAEGGKPAGTTAGPKQETRKPPTDEEIAQLVKDMARLDPKKLEQAAREAAEAARTAKVDTGNALTAEEKKQWAEVPKKMEDAARNLMNPEQRKAVEEALKQVEKELQARENGQPEKGQPMNPETRTNNDPNNRSNEPGNPGSGTPGGGNRTGPAGNGPPDGPADRADPRHKQFAGNLQLEDLKKQVTPEVLKKIGWTQEDLERFYKEYRDVQAPRDREALTGPQRGGTLTNQGVRQVTPGSNANPGNLQNAGPALPPPEYRNAYRGYTEDLSKTKK